MNYNSSVTIHKTSDEPVRAPASPPGMPLARTDAIFLILLAVITVALSIGNWRVLGDSLPLPFVDSTWFEADSPGYYQMMTDRLADHSDTRTHPLFSLLTWPFVTLLEKVIGLEPAAAVAIHLAFIGVLWIALLYAVLRRLGCRSCEALLFGDETFLYAPQYFALLIVLAALGLRTRLRPLVWLLAGALLLAAGVHNQQERASAVTALRQYVAKPGKFHPLGVRRPWARPRPRRPSGVSSGRLEMQPSAAIIAGLKLTPPDWRKHRPDLEFTQEPTN